jgi:uncharacterized protein
MTGFRKVRGAFLCGIFSLAILNSSCSKRSELANVRAEAKRGNSEAQFRLGAYYHDTVEVAPDYQAAALWFRQAAEQGHAGAQFALGEMYLNAEGMLPDEVQAAKWIQTAAEQGYAPAQNELAVLYSQGIGVTRDDVEAVNWATKAAEQSYLEAQYHLGCLLSTNAPGRAPADLVAACVWLSLAAAEGDIESQELLQSLQGRLTSTQLEEVKRRTALWKQKHAGAR